MPNNIQKTPFTQYFGAAVANVVNSAVALLGKSYPATVKTVMGNTVQANYEITTQSTLPTPQMPVLMSRYVRFPVQTGDKGMTISADAYLGGMSGLGGGTADLTQRGNLSTSVWHPISSTAWPSVDPNKLTLTGGPSGVLLRSDEGSAASISLTTSAITFTVGGVTMTINASGITLQNILWLTHEHTLVTTGESLSGPPNV